MKTITLRPLRMMALAAFALFLLVLAGCDSTPPPAAKSQAAPRTKPLVGVLLYTDADVYISLVSRALQEALNGKVDYAVLSAGRDQFVQNEQIEELLARKASALAVNLVDILAASHIVDKAQKAGIPVVFFNREPDLNGIRTYDRTCFIGTTPLDAGKMQGDIIKRLWDAHPEYDRNKDGMFQYVMLQANTDNPEAIARTEYSVRQARDLGVSMRQIGETMLCDWDEDQAYQAMRLALASLKDSVELVVANNDSMALGAIRALTEQGYNLENGEPGKFIPVIGVDAVPQAVDAIRKGIMSATVRQDGSLMGQTIAAFVLNAVNGKAFLEGTPWQWDDTGIALRLPYSPFEGAK